LAGEYPKYPLIEAALRRSPLSRSWTIVAAVGVLLLLLVLTAFLGDELASLLEWDEMVFFVFLVLFIIYFLLVYPFMLRSREQAVLAFKPLLSLEDDAFNKVAENISKPNRRWEWIAIFLGMFAFMGINIQPWNTNGVSDFSWLTVYFAVTLAFVYGLMGWLIYDTLIGIIRISRLSRRDLKLDILDTETLAPVAAWSLGISLVFVGAILLSIIGNVAQSGEVLLNSQTIIGYVVMICITLLIFFFSMWTAHRALSVSKKSKLTLARKHLAEISLELEDQVEKGQRRGMMELSSTITALATYEKRVKEAPTWPFNAAIVRRLFVSILSPGLVFLLKLLSQGGIRFST
jgi:hypothetical protein